MTYRTPLILAALLSASCQTLPDAPTLDVAERFVWSEPPTLVASGLEPDATYTLVTERRSFWNDQATERSSLEFVASERGVIDTSRNRAKGKEIADPYIPIQSMDYLSDDALDDLDTGRIRFSLRDKDQELIVQRTVGIGPDIDEIEERPLGGDFPGAYILSRKDQDGPRPALVVLGGSEGGDRGSRSAAPTLAAEGYVVLGLPYYSPAWFGQEQQFPNLPNAFAELPVDYLEQAVAALRKQSEVDPDRISLQGVSKGAEFVLLAGALIPDDSPGGGFCGIIADVPTDVVWEGWGPGARAGKTSGFSWRGEPLPFVPYENMSRALDRSDPYTMTEAHENGRDAYPERAQAARIAIEQIDEPVMVIGGDKDTTWASGPMSRAIAETREKAGLLTEVYVYPEGGHGVGGSPLVRTTKANLEARKEVFPAMMAFHKRNSLRDDCRG